ncbi:MAG: hypothetical protein FJX47_07245, partial [Alphaproteobacteria bacterium]|nr:hypothetical protein [Alphaproteobacteria bacterium]
MHGAATGAAFEPHVLFGMSPLWVSTTLLVVVYLTIMSERLNRAIVALVGAGIMIVIGCLDQEEAVKGIDWNTIALLTGMMILVGVTRKSGVFEYVAILSAKWAKANPAGLLVLLQIVTAVFSALLDNVTTVLLIVPVTFAVTQRLKVNPYPFLFAEIFASNIGGTSTLIGDPPNIMIGSMVGIDFNAFVVNLAPVVVVIQTLQILAIHVLWGRHLKASPEDRAAVMAMDEKEAIQDWRLLKQSSAVVGAVIVAFVLARQLHLEPGTIAMTGAAVLMLLDNIGLSAEKQSERVTQAFTEVEWVTIFFFVGLFVVVHGVEVGGL